MREYMFMYVNLSWGEYKVEGKRVREKEYMFIYFYTNILN